MGPEFDEVINWKISWSDSAECSELANKTFTRRDDDGDGRIFRFCSCHADWVYGLFKKNHIISCDVTYRKAVYGLLMDTNSSRYRTNMRQSMPSFYTHATR